MSATRELDLWDLVRWVYQDQKAHRYLAHKSDWFDWAIDRTTRGEIDVNVPVAHDAAMVHAAVVIQPAAELIVHMAAAGIRPEQSGAPPRPMPMPPDESRMRSTDRASWATIDGRRVNHVVRTVEKLRIVELVEKRARRKDRKPVIEERLVLVDVEYCPIDWWPDPAFIAMVNGIYGDWVGAMNRLLAALGETNLRSHRVTGFAHEAPFVAAPRSRPDFEDACGAAVTLDRERVATEHLTREDGMLSVVALQRHARVTLAR